MPCNREKFEVFGSAIDSIEDIKDHQIILDSASVLISNPDGRHYKDPEKIISMIHYLLGLYERNLTRSLDEVEKCLDELRESI